MSNKKEPKCSICGNKGTHEFGSFNAPYGEGDFEDTGRKCMGCPVVRWTGKKRRVKYWECDECFMKEEDEYKIE